MKQLKFTLWLQLFLSCTSGDDYVSIQQIDSHFPVLLKVNNETIQYIEFPLVFQIEKTIDKVVKLSGDGYFYNAKYSKLLKGWLFNGNIFVNAKGKLIRPTLNDELRKLSKDKREFFFMYAIQI